ncbi:hypothetical protein [Rugamonas aquatica]|uniref:Uncharacterized protein n=1 Tax=Rugamonas aquatica TaxID=2743357 RepID=A0A6A7N6F1_9BURK|nr:hypothetical protein [Rugamonas aquatica]MQA40705.1 hypothetical protein [Rugamonas aquatica]
MQLYPKKVKKLNVMTSISSLVRSGCNSFGLLQQAQAGAVSGSLRGWPAAPGSYLVARMIARHEQSGAQGALQPSLRRFAADLMAAPMQDDVVGAAPAEYASRLHSALAQARAAGVPVAAIRSALTAMPLDSSQWGKIELACQAVGHWDADVLYVLRNKAAERLIADIESLNASSREVLLPVLTLLAQTNWVAADVDSSNLRAELGRARELMRPGGADKVLAAFDNLLSLMDVVGSDLSVQQRIAGNQHLILVGQKNCADGRRAFEEACERQERWDSAEHAKQRRTSAEAVRKILSMCIA